MGGKIRTVEATEQDIWEAGQRIEDRQDQAFFYGLYLTAARTAELAQMGPDWPVMQKGGEWYFSLPILKRRGKKSRTRPFFPAPPTPWEEKMLETLIAWLRQKPGRAFDYQPNRRGQYNEPYDNLTKGGVMVRVTEEGTTKEEPVRPHWLRRFRITNLLLRSAGNVLAVRDFVGQKEYASTLRYYEGTEMAFENLRKQAFGRAAPAAPSPPKPEPPERPPEPSPAESLPKPSE